MPGDQGDIEEALSRSLVANRLFGDADGIQLGRFRLLRYLGRGAVGVVYEADDPQRGRVAVKLLEQTDPRGVYRVKQEFRAIAGVEHPNLVTLHELVHERGQWFFSMELVEGVPFDRWSRAPGSGPDHDKLASALEQLASAVVAIHASGKLHCDLKPSNVLVTHDGVVKVLDFGLVSEHADESRGADTGLSGTPEYIAPEQAAGRNACPASDWYAVGVMLYGVLVGRTPFDGDPFRVLHAKQNQDAPDLAVPSGQSPRLYKLCEHLLRRDPAERAGADEIFAVMAYRADGARLRGMPRSAPPPSTLFVGREHELEELRSALHCDANSTASFALIGGTSGIGKSALLDRFADELDDSVLLLRGRCYEHESLPYKVFDTAIDALSRHLRTWSSEQAERVAPRHITALTRLFPVLGRVDAFSGHALRPPSSEPESLRAQAFGAAKELLQRLTDRKRVVIMVDDLQWGDLDSARMLAHVFGPPDPPPLLFVGAYRDAEAKDSPFVSALLDERINGRAWNLQQIELEPLPATAAARLASELLGRDREAGTNDSQTALAVAQEAAGVPFFITELVEQVRARRARGESYAMLASLEQAVIGRVQALPAPCRELLDVLVVASQPIEPQVALCAGELSFAERSYLQTLRTARLVRGHGGAQSELVEVYHDRIRDLLSSRMKPERSRILHARIAAAMEQQGVLDPDRLVAHYVGAEDRVRAAQTTLSAAEAAVRKLAFNRAAELYTRALEFLPADDPQRRALRVSLADALVNAGRGARASEQYLLAAQEAEPAVARELQLNAAQQCLRSGLTTRGLELAEPLLQRHGVSLQGGRTRLIARLLVERARGHLPSIREDASQAEAAERLRTLGGLFQELMITDPLRGAILHAAFLRHAMRQPDPVPRLKAQAWACIQATLLGGSRNERTAAELFHNVVQLRHEIDTPYARAMEHLTATRVHQSAARFGLGFEHGGKARALFEQCPGTHWERAHAALVQLTCAEFVGHLSVITAVVPELVRAAAEREDEGALMQVTFSMALARLAADEPEATLAFLEKRQSLIGEGFSILHYLAAHRIADCHIYLEHPEVALAIVQERWPQTVAMDHYTSVFLRAVAHSLRARVTISAFARTRSRALVPIIRADLRKLDTLQHGYGGVGLVLHGTFNALRGDRGGAISLIERGIAQLEAEGIERFLHCAKRRLGEVVSGDEGAAMIARADADLALQGVRRPERFTAVMVSDMRGPETA